MESLFRRGGFCKCKLSFVNFGVSFPNEVVPSLMAELIA